MNRSSRFSACTTMCNVIETADKWKFIGTRVQLTWASTKFHMLTFCKCLRARYVYMFLVYMNFSANKKERNKKKWFMRMLLISSWYSKTFFSGEKFRKFIAWCETLLLHKSQRIHWIWLFVAVSSIFKLESQLKMSFSKRIHIRITLIQWNIWEIPHTSNSTMEQTFEWHSFQLKLVRFVSLAYD